MRKFRVPSYRLHKPSGRGVVTVGGKLVYLPGEFRSEESQAAYRRVLRDKLHSDIVDLPTKFAESIAQHGNPTLRSLLAAYLLHAERTYVDPATGKFTPEIAHLKVVIEVMNEIAGDLAARDFGPLKLQSCQRAFVARGYTRKTVNDYTNRSRRIFKWAVSNEILPGSVLHSLQALPGLRRGRTTAGECRVVHGVAEADVRKVLPHLSRQVQTIIELLWLTGARPSEILNLRPCEVDKVGVEIATDQRCWILTPGRHKNTWRGVDRRILVGPRGQELLKPFLDRNTDAFCFSPLEAEAVRVAELREARKTKRWKSHIRYQAKKKARTKRRVLRDKYSPSSLYTAVQRACREAGVPPWFPYQLRHSAGTRLARAYGREAAGEVLGHRDSRTTGRYVDPNVDAAARSMFEAG